MAKKHMIIATIAGGGLLLGGCSGSPEIAVPQAVECQLTYEAGAADVTGDETVRVERIIGEDGDVDTAIFGQGTDAEMEFMVSYHASAPDHTQVLAYVDTADEGSPAGAVNLVGGVEYRGDVPDGPLIGPDEEIHGDATLSYLCEGSA